MPKVKHQITIEPDGWVWLKKNDGTEIGLGDLGVDVETIDMTPNV